MTEDHNRGELVIDHHRGGIELMAAVRVNWVGIVRCIAPIITMMRMSEMGRNVHATNSCAEAGIRGANDVRSTVESEVISHGGETHEGGEQCIGRQSDIHFDAPQWKRRRITVQPASHALEQSFVTKHYGFNINAVHIMVMALCIVKRSGYSSHESVLTVLAFLEAQGEVSDHLLIIRPHAT